MKRNIRLAAALITILVICGCGESKQSEAQGNTGSDNNREVAKNFVEGLNLRGPIPPGGCEVLTETKATEILGGEVRKRPGGGDVCTFVSGNGDEQSMIRLLITSFPLESIKITDDPMKIALTLQGWATAKESLVQTDDFGGKPAFTSLEEGASVVWLVPGVNTTSVTSDKAIGEVVVQASLKSSAPHDARLEILKDLVRETQDFLNAQGG